MEGSLIWLVNLCSLFSAVLMCFSFHMGCIVKIGFSAFPTERSGSFHGGGVRGPVMYMH